MKKFIYQLIIGLIFLLFGFMVTSQLNMREKQKVVAENKQSPEILVENEQLKKQKDELEKKVNELIEKSQNYENAAAGKTDESNLLVQELQETRLRAGLTDVKGPGVIIYITPKANLFAAPANRQPIIDFDLLGIVNELNAAGAEAVSINDIRLTNRGGIRTAGNGIIINNERISPQKRVTIKAIGKKKDLENATNFPGTISVDLKNSCEVSIESSDEVVIKKGQDALKYEYVKEVEK
ncbi:MULTISPECIES: DUF881 domain-containing protein [Clostridium]|uniref:DUF881 domain-containing protein n=1 Tax=Clostridium TaxID=1485 RepID=UPI000301C789|nr:MULTISPECIES: DUF881 domain-containing protein [Clostridium]